MSDLVDLYPKALRLLLLLGIHGADSDLNQTLGKLLFHDAGEGGCMRKAAALELVVKIRVRIEMNKSRIPRTCVRAPAGSDR